MYGTFNLCGLEDVFWELEDVFWELEDVFWELEDVFWELTAEEVILLSSYV